MAVLKSRHFRIPGAEGAAKGWKAVATLVSGAVVLKHGFSIIESCKVTPIHLDTAAAVQTFTLTGLTINTNGFPKVTAGDGQSTLKSNEGSSTVTVLVEITGY